MFYMWTRKRTPSPRLPDSDTDMDAEFVDVDEKNCALREHANRTHRFPTMSRGFTTFANGEGDGHTPLSSNRWGEKRVRNALIFWSSADWSSTVTQGEFVINGSLQHPKMGTTCFNETKSTMSTTTPMMGNLIFSSTCHYHYHKTGCSPIPQSQSHLRSEVHRGVRSSPSRIVRR